MTCLARYDAAIASQNCGLRCKAASRRGQHHSKALLVGLSAPRFARSVGFYQFIRNVSLCIAISHGSAIAHPTAENTRKRYLWGALFNYPGTEAAAAPKGHPTSIASARYLLVFTTQTQVHKNRCFYQLKEILIDVDSECEILSNLCRSIDAISK